MRSQYSLLSPRCAVAEVPAVLDSVVRSTDGNLPPSLPDQFFTIPMVTGNEMPSGGNTSFAGWHKTSPEHNRAYDYRPVGGTQDVTLQTDQYGNTFYCIGLKGNAATGNAIEPMTAEADGYRVYGLQRSVYGNYRDTVDALMMKSDRIRSAGIDTEWILGSSRPKHFPINGRLLDLHRMRNHLVRLLDESPDGTVLQERRMKRIVNVAMRDFFFVSWRAQKTPYRVGDLTALSDDVDYLRSVVLTVADIDTLEQNTKGIHVEQMSDEMKLYNLLATRLPQRLGNNLRKLEDLKLVQMYLHMGNISLLGGLPDVDSIMPEEDSKYSRHAIHNVALKKLADRVANVLTHSFKIDEQKAVIRYNVAQNFYSSVEATHTTA